MARLERGRWRSCYRHSLQTLLQPIRTAYVARYLTMHVWMEASTRFPHRLIAVAFPTSVRARGAAADRVPTEMMVAFIDDHRRDYGVEPICKVPPIAGRRRSGRRSQRAERTEVTSARS